MRQGHVRLDAIEVTALDEADHMAARGFLPAVRRLLDATPSDGQRLLSSATVDGDGDGDGDVLVRRYLRDPRVHAVDEPSNSVPAMTHRLVTVRAQHKRAVVHELLSGPERTLAFARTKHGARTLARRLSEAGIPSLDLHGNLSQAARTRNLDAYLHRSGCTARAGSTGTVVTIATPEQRSAVRNLVRPAAHREGDSHRRKPRDRGVHHGIEPARLRAAVCGAPVRVDQAPPGQSAVAPRTLLSLTGQRTGADSDARPHGTPRARAGAADARALRSGWCVASTVHSPRQSGVDRLWPRTHCGVRCARPGSAGCGHGPQTRRGCRRPEHDATSAPGAPRPTRQKKPSIGVS